MCFFIAECKIIFFPFAPPSSSSSFSLCLDEDVLVLWFQDTFTDELLRDGYGYVVGHTQVRQVVKEPAQKPSGETSASLRCSCATPRPAVSHCAVSHCAVPRPAVPHLGSRFFRTRLTKVSTSVLVMCFSSSLRLLCSRAVMVSSAKMS